MVGSGDQLASLTSRFFGMRLAAVSFLSFSSGEFADLIATASRILKVKSAIGASDHFWLSGQLWHVWCSFGTTSSPSEWRSISFGNQNGISWKACTSFNAIFPVLISFGLFSLVSLTWFSIFLCSTFIGQTGEILMVTGCRKAYYFNGGS